MAYIEPSVHLGKVVAARLEDIGMAKAEFGRRIDTSRQTINTLLRKKTFDSTLMLNISKVIKLDLFALIQSDLEGETMSHFNMANTSPRLSITLDLGVGKVDEKLLSKAVSAFNSIYLGGK